MTHKHLYVTYLVSYSLSTAPLVGLPVSLLPWWLQPLAWLHLMTGCAGDNDLHKPLQVIMTHINHCSIEGQEEYVHPNWLDHSNNLCAKLERELNTFIAWEQPGTFGWPTALALLLFIGFIQWWDSLSHLKTVLFIINPKVILYFWKIILWKMRSRFPVDLNPP